MIKTLIARIGLLALALWLSLLPHDIATAQTRSINAGNLGLVFYPQGILTNLGEGQWSERGADGKIRSYLVETRRTWDAVFLKDYQRQIELELNLTHRYIFFLNPGTEKTPLHRILEARSRQDAAYYQISTRIKGADKCLEAYRSTHVAVPEANGRSVPMQRFDPAFVNCNDSLGQRWSIRDAGDFNGGPTFQWQNQQIEFAGLDLCLTSRGHGGVLAMTQCRQTRAQRWLHRPPDHQPKVRHLRSLSEPKTWCMTLSKLAGPAIPGDLSFRKYIPDHLPKIAKACQDGDSGPVPTLRIRRLTQ